MNTHEKDTFLQTYDWVKSWEDLPWAHDEATLFLANISLLSRAGGGQPGRALDIGCGAGTDSVFLASQGWDVTSLDFMPKALEFTQQRAAAAGVSVTPVEADITDWEAPHQYDLVLDHGLLHNMDPVRYPAYRDCIMRTLADGGHFVLLHWHPLFPDQPQGEIGPTRTSRADIKAFFAPDLQERFFAREEFEDLPEMVGRGMTQAFYWFQRNKAEAHPAELLTQIEETLARHKVDFATFINEAGDAPLDADVSAELMARILGPGRLGISHTVPETSSIADIISVFAAKTGRSAIEVENLLRVFASDKHGNVCLTNAKCTECDVKFCKRLRYR
jgi:SAM-dependent methyltransferase